MYRLVFIALIGLFSPAHAVELFGVPLVSADKGSLGFAVQRAGGTLQKTERNQVFEVFDSSEVLDTSFRLYLGFDVQTGKFGFAEYHIHRMAHETMVSRLTEKYGSAQITKGEFISDQHYAWRVNGIDVTLQKTRGCMCSRLLYSEPATHQEVRRQHEQVQKQRAEEALDEFRKAY